VEGGALKIFQLDGIAAYYLKLATVAEYTHKYKYYLQSCLINLPSDRKFKF